MKIIINNEEKTEIPLDNYSKQFMNTTITLTTADVSLIPLTQQRTKVIMGGNEFYATVKRIKIDRVKGDQDFFKVTMAIHPLINYVAEKW